MSVTHLRLGAGAVKSRFKVLGAGDFAGSACVVVGVNALRMRLWRPNSRIAVATVLRQADSSSSCCPRAARDLHAAVDAVRLGMHLGHGRLDPLATLGPRARRPIDRGIVATRRDAQDFAHPGHGKRVAMFTGSRRTSQRLLRKIRRGFF